MALDRSQALAARLRRAGVLTERAWLDAFEAVPREVFVPRFFTASGDGWRAVSAGDDGWLDQVYSDQVLVTQLDGDDSAWERARADGPVPGTPTCSSSMPTIMAIMLEELRTGDHARVLEVGTGTGYNTALLCHRLGDANVSTVDVDPALVRTATAALGRVGHHPECVTGDGARGLPGSAPFDRVLCTCAVSAIPPDWVAQTRPGGLIVTTLNRPIGAGLVRLVAEEGTLAHGRVLAKDGRFMPLRAHRLADPAQLLSGLQDAEARETRRTSLPVSAVLSPSSPLEFFASLELEGVLPAYSGDAGVVYLVHPDGSWVRHAEQHGKLVVSQGGPRNLWDLAEQARVRWRKLGKPGRARFGVTVDGDRQEFWLDNASSQHRWQLGSVL
ncbi:ATP-grasp peptide maturase system methyltransferase [Amycolatopsis sp. YIM 10]|uniref:ATP-grasp peptide maturase system methyltransferase n=1 Tax=Amycolatopsis sp. YIM 10 TaxID=2653857 RepID=UPI0012901342|nr:ATP-grasp peptide maturase system methyltransferase [Amycolatopsis sp. YIM 10]QFU94243.1 Protein-L-isoaspartate O-methyltransferase [Amycolatopsis sp. YIM 10]